MAEVGLVLAAVVSAVAGKVTDAAIDRAEKDTILLQRETMYTHSDVIASGNTSNPYDSYPEGVRIPEEKLLLGVCLGVALLFALCFVAVVGAVACRGQHFRKAGRRERRPEPSISVAHSDFDTYSRVNNYNSSPPSTDISIISSSSASIYATPMKMKAAPIRSQIGPKATPTTTPPSTTTSSSSCNSNDSGGGSGGFYYGRNPQQLLKTDGWRYIEPMITPVDVKSQSDSSSLDIATPTNDHQSNKKTRSREWRGMQAFSTKILSPAYTGKKHG